MAQRFIVFSFDQLSKGPFLAKEIFANDEQGALAQSGYLFAIALPAKLHSKPQNLVFGNARFDDPHSANA